MTLAQLLANAAGIAVDKLREALAAAAEAAPDLAGDIAVILAKLDEAITPEALTALAGTSLDELRKLFKGGTDGRFHAGDLG